MLLQSTNRRAHAGQERPFLPPGEARFKCAPGGRGIGFLPLRHPLRIPQPALKLPAHGKQRRRGILVQPRQRPVGLVAAAVAVPLEKLLESIEEHRAGERRAEVVERAVVFDQIPHRPRVMTRRRGQRHEVDRLLRAHRTPPCGELRIDETVVGEAGGAAGLADEVFPELHAAHYEDGRHRAGRQVEPLPERRPDVAIGEGQRIGRGEPRERVRGHRLVPAEDVPGAQIVEGEPQEVRERAHDVAKRRPGRDLVLGTNPLGVPHRPQRVREGRAHHRGGAPELREIEVEPPVERFHHGTELGLRRDQPAKEPSLTEIEQVDVDAGRLR